MADFTNFESADVPQTEEDPAAAFLAREQDELAALEGDDFTAAAPAEQVQQQQAADGDGDFGAGVFGTEDTTSAPADAGMFDPLGGTDDAQIGDDAGFDQFDQQQDTSQDPYTAIKTVDVQRQEPEKIRIWREDQIERLAKKDCESEKKSGEWRVAAKKELEDWYKHGAEQFEKTKKTNREGEDAFIHERDETLPGHEWERICRLCDFNPKASRTSKDISRMRSILLQLKQSGIQRD